MSHLKFYDKKLKNNYSYDFLFKNITQKIFFIIFLKNFLKNFYRKLFCF